jgi:hypothetical protein
MDEISSSPEVRETFQAAIDVVDAGYRVLRSPGAEKRLGGDYTALQATLRSLEIALANHARAAEKTPSQAFAPSSASTPASFPRSPLLGVAIADDVVILVILLFAAAAVAVTAGQAGKPPPKITHQDVFNPWNKFWRSRWGWASSKRGNCISWSRRLSKRSRNA